MPIKVKCKCGKVLSAPDKLAGKKVRCTGCKKIFVVPSPKPKEPEIPVLEVYVPEKTSAPQAKKKSGFSSFNVSKKIVLEASLTTEDIKQFIKNQLSQSCKLKVTSDMESSLEISGRVYEKVFTPVTKFSASFDIRIENNIARIHASGKSGTNWVFLIFFLVGLFTGIFLIIGIGLFLIQRNKPKTAIEEVLQALDIEYGTA